MGKSNLENLKLKVATQVGVKLSNYNGDITTRQAGLIGGNMVRELIARAEENLSAAYPEDTTYNYVNTPNTYTNNSNFLF